MTTEGEGALLAAGLSKRYGDVLALSRSRRRGGARASSSRSSARTAPARARSSGSPPGSSTPTTGDVLVEGYPAGSIEAPRRSLVHQRPGGALRRPERRRAHRVHGPAPRPRGLAALRRPAPRDPPPRGPGRRPAGAVQPRPAPEDVTRARARPAVRRPPGRRTLRRPRSRGPDRAHRLRSGRDAGTAVVVATHQLGFLEHATRCLALRAGEPAFDGPVDIDRVRDLLD